jgi:3-methyl-2-oxobutanoate hydroxymethyltransferase
MNILGFLQKKEKGEKITFVTCYDYTSALLLSKTSVDALLVGDSLAMTMHGFPTTVQATLDMLVLHTAAVARGAPKKFIVGDLPFLSYRKNLSDNIAAAQALMQAGAHAVKLEGTAGNTELIRHLVESGVPVMGHIGLTPQSVHQLGGFRVQGKTEAAAERLMLEALALEEAGCFSIVLECVPAKLATEISVRLSIPTIGIGAGAGTDGQILVWQDMLGLNPEFQPKFVRQFVNGAEVFTRALEGYTEAVRKGEFPANEHSY